MAYYDNSVLKDVIGNFRTLSLFYETNITGLDPTEPNTIGTPTDDHDNDPLQPDQEPDRRED